MSDVSGMDRQAGLQRLLRGALCLGVLAASAGILVHNEAWRILEAALAAGAMSWAGVVQATAISGTTLIVVPDPVVHGLMVTPDCTSGYLIGAVGVAAAPLLLLRRLPLRRVLLGVALTVAVLLLSNIGRLVVSEQIVQVLGLADGLRVGHDIVGTIITTVGASSAVVVALLCLTPRRRSGRPSPAVHALRGV